MIHLAYKKYGESGENILILHGLFGMLDNWHTLATEFSKKFTVWLVDLRNHGRSAHSDEFDYFLLAEDIFDFIHEHHLDKVHLIGHSMGGKAAMKFSFFHPQLLHSLTVVDIAPRAYADAHSEIIEALKKINLASLTKRSEADALLAEYIPEADTRLFLLKNLNRTETGFAWRMNLPSLDKNYSTISGDVGKGVFHGKVLFMSGEKSKYITVTDMERIHKQFPHAEVEIIKDAGHWIHADNPQLFYETVMSFWRT